MSGTTEAGAIRIVPERYLRLICDRSEQNKALLGLELRFIQCKL